MGKRELLEEALGPPENILVGFAVPWGAWLMTLLISDAGCELLILPGSLRPQINGHGNGDQPQQTPEETSSRRSTRGLRSLRGREGAAGLTFSLENDLVKHRYLVTLDLNKPSFQRSASTPSAVCATYTRETEHAGKAGGTEACEPLLRTCAPEHLISSLHWALGREFPKGEKGECEKHNF